MGTGACTAIDVMHILRKARQPVTDCVVELDADARGRRIRRSSRASACATSSPAAALAPAQVERAIKLSKEKYCSATIMLAATAADHLRLRGARGLTLRPSRRCASSPSTRRASPPSPADGSSAAPSARPVAPWRISSSRICSTIARLRRSLGGQPLEVALEMPLDLRFGLGEESEAPAIAGEAGRHAPARTSPRTRADRARSGASPVRRGASRHHAR